MLKKLYLGFGIGVILLYVITSLVGFETTAPKETQSLGIMRMTRTKPAPVSRGGGSYPIGAPRGGK